MRSAAKASIAYRVPAVSVAPTGGISRDHGERRVQLWGWGLVLWTPAFLMRTYDLNVAQAGAVTGQAHLAGGLLATAGAAWLMARPYMVSPRRVLWTLAAVIGFATIPSLVAYWTHALWVAKLMFWIYIPAIYFFIGPCMALVLNLAPSNMRSIFTAWSVLVGNVFNLIVAPEFVGIMSDFFADGHGADAASLRLALLVLAPTGFWAVWHFYWRRKTVVADKHARNRLLARRELPADRATQTRARDQ